MDSSYSSLVTMDMIPDVWHFNEEQERDWLEHVAKDMPGETATTLQRMLAIELPDIKGAWTYLKRFEMASKTRKNLVPLVITARDQWKKRQDEMAKIVKCLVEGTPPVVAICAMAVPKQSVQLVPSDTSSTRQPW